MQALPWYDSRAETPCETGWRLCHAMPYHLSFNRALTESFAGVIRREGRRKGVPFEFYRCNIGPILLQFQAAVLKNTGAVFNRFFSFEKWLIIRSG